MEKSYEPGTLSERLMVRKYYLKLKEGFGIMQNTASMFGLAGSILKIQTKSVMNKKNLLPLPKAKR